MDRRRFLLTSLAGALAVSLGAEAQQTGEVPRIGTLSASPSSRDAKGVVESFFRGLRDHGYVIGKNIQVEQRWAEQKPERLDKLARELIGLPVDILVTMGMLPTAAAKRVTETVPIVMAFGSDPVAAGFVASLARPGGNITGLAWQYDELGAKQLELLHEMVPQLSRVAILYYAANPGESLPRVEAMERGAQSLGITTERIGVQRSQDFESAFAAMVDRRTDGVLVAGDPFTYLHRTQIIELANQYRLPAAYSLPQYTEAGGLLSYGANLRGSMRQSAAYVDKILKGARPGDLAMERPTKFDLLINLKTAKMLGLTIPPSLLARADQIIK